ncbi:MAG: metallophosphoesterase [Promethearchaeota archaeon]
MKIAVVSDSHDNRDKILKAVSIINKRDVDALIHCGDFISAFVVRWFDGLKESVKERFFGVYGNNDGDRVFLKQNLGQICDLVGMELISEFDGKRVIAIHMPNQETVDAIASSGKFDIVLFGHTHALLNKKYDNGVLVVNPGELCGYLTGRSTFAIVDTDEMEAEIIDI